MGTTPDYPKIDHIKYLLNPTTAAPAHPKVNKYMDQTTAVPTTATKDSCDACSSKAPQPCKCNGECFLNSCYETYDCDNGKIDSSQCTVHITDKCDNCVN